MVAVNKAIEQWLFNWFEILGYKLDNVEKNNLQLTNNVHLQIWHMTTPSKKFLSEVESETNAGNVVILQARNK